MSKLTLTIPNLYADHHVTQVRRTLMQMSGVENVIASSAFNSVIVEFDGKLTQNAIVDALTKAGYPPGEPEVVERSPFATADPAWDKLGVRATTTNPVDLQLSGEFRKY